MGSLYKAVDRARQLIAAGAHPGAAYELSAREQGVAVEDVRRLVRRAEYGCDAARETIAHENRRIERANSG